MYFAQFSVDRVLQHSNVVDVYVHNERLKLMWMNSDMGVKFYQNFVYVNYE